jgi:group I intron endonuclease
MDSDEHKYGWVYGFINKVNNKKYIGQSWEFDRRIKDHKNGYGYAKLLKSAIEKYGIDNFDIVKFQKATTQEELDRLEIELIRVLNTLQPNGYNLAQGGSHGKHSESTKKLIGSYHKNKIVSEGTKQKLSEKLKGRKRQNETIEKIVATQKQNFQDKNKSIYFFDCLTHRLVTQYKNTYEMKQTIDIPHNRVFGSISTNSKFQFGEVYCYARYVNEPLDKKFTFGRKVIVTTNDGYNQVFQSKTEAEKVLKLGRGIIDNLVRGKSKTSKYMLNGEYISFTAKYADPIA